MLSKKQRENIIYVTNHFLENELKGWTRLDDMMMILEELDDCQVFKEADNLYSHHKNKTMGCPYIHADGVPCLVNNILEAVESILDLYKEKSNLHPKNRYILCYYLVLSNDGQILEVMGSNAI